MNLSFISLLICILFALVSKVTGKRRLVAVSSGKHVLSLYEKFKNEFSPSQSDPAITSASARRSICQDITNSGVFPSDRVSRHLHAVNVKRIYVELKKDRSASNIFHQLFDTRKSEDPRHVSDEYTYKNSFLGLEFTLYAHGRAIKFKESVFLCLMKYSDSFYEGLQTLHVSKEYNVNGDPYRPIFGRFIFANLPSSTSVNWKNSVKVNHIMLAEEPASLYMKNHFNLELYYLHLRSRRQPVKSDVSDPVCRRLLKNDGEYHRLCVAVLKSPHFRKKLPHPKNIRFNDRCRNSEVSFRTTKGIQVASDGKYREYMFSCQHRGDDGTGEIYISRAYRSNYVFVYERNNNDGELYLQSLMTHVSIVDEPSINDVEE